jgi:hypothetical protein
LERKWEGFYEPEKDEKRQEESFSLEPNPIRLYHIFILKRIKLLQKKSSQKSGKCRIAAQHYFTCMKIAAKESRIDKD